MGTPKKKLPKVIKSLPQLGLFARVVVEKLSQKEIDKWTRRAPEPTPKSTQEAPEPAFEPTQSTLESKSETTRRVPESKSESDYVQSNCSRSSSEDESSVKSSKKYQSNVRKRSRVNYIDSSELSSSDTSSLDSSEAESYTRKRRKRRRKSQKKRRKRDKSDEESQRRVLPVRSAKRRVPIIYSDSEEEDLSSNLIPVRSNRSTTSKAASVAVNSAKVPSQRDFVDPSQPSTSTAILSHVSADVTPAIEPSVSSAKTKNSVPDSSSETENRNQHVAIGVSLRSDIANSNSLSDSGVKKIIPVSSLRPASPKKYLSEITGENVVSSSMLPTSSGDSSGTSSRNSSELPTNNDDDSWKVVSNEENVDVLDKFKVVNKDETNVGKIRLRSLQSLGASDSFIKEAKLQHNFREGKIIESLYAKHVSHISVKNLLEQIAENLMHKIIVTEEFNLVLRESGIENKSKPPEIVNTRMEAIVQRRLGCDKTITKLFTNVVELFFSTLERQNELEYFSTLLYLGFLYLINYFMKITNHQYKRSSLFKNLILVFIESLRNGNFKYTQIENFFLSNNFHAHCYKLIEHIGTIQSQNCNLRLMKVSQESSPAEQGLKSVPVRAISCKMRNSKLVIEYTKNLEDLETSNEENLQESKKPSNSRKPIRTYSSAQPSLEPASVIVSSNQNEPPIDQNIKARMARVQYKNSIPVNPCSNSVTVTPRSNCAPNRPVHASNIPQNPADLTLHNLLSSVDCANELNLRCLLTQNQQTSVIHPTPQNDAPHLANVATTSGNSSISKTNNFNSRTASSTMVPGTAFSKQPANIRTPVQVVRPIRAPKQPVASRSGEDETKKTKNRQIIAQTGTPLQRATLTTVPQVSQNMTVSDLPPYSQAVENIYPTAVDPSQLRHVLTGDRVQRTNMLANQQLVNIPNQQLSHSERSCYNVSSIVTMANPSIVTSNSQPSNRYQPLIPNPSPYIAQNPTISGGQARNNNSFAFPLNNMNSSPDLRSSNQNMQQYQVPQNQNLNSSFNTNITNNSAMYRNNPLDNQPVYYDNNVASNQMVLNNMSSSAVNQEINPSFYDYTPPVSLNQMHSQVNPAYVQSAQNQMQSPLVPLNQALAQSVAANQFAQPAAVSPSSVQQADPYFPAPSTTVHWVTQDSSYSNPYTVDSFSNQIQFPKYQPS